jgi:lysophospholipase L1-like esterase
VAVTVVFVTVATMAELAARVVGPEAPEWQLHDAAGTIMVGHPTRLWGLSPGVKHNGNAAASINTLGMRGALPLDPKPAGRPRVLVVGDSTFFGHGVNDDETFPSQLAQVLKERGIDAEVLNGAVPGYSSEQSRVELDEIGWSLAPDLLLIGSLWSDNNIDHFRDEDLLKTNALYRNELLFRSAFFRLLAGAIDRARGGEGAHLVTWTHDSQFPSKGTRRVSLQRYGENLDAMVRDAAARGIGAAFVGPCNSGQVEGKYADGASWDPFFDAQRQIAAFHHIPWIETLPAMKAAANGGSTGLFVDLMHPSAAGHRVFATVAADTLLGAGWPATPLLASSDVFPADTLVDNGFRFGPPSPSSPQHNLFVVSGTDASAAPALSTGTASAAPAPGAPATGTASAAQAPGAPTTGAAPAPSGPSPAVPAGAATSAATPAVTSDPSVKWTLTGTLTGGVGPYAVDLRRPDGGVLANARLPTASPFELHVRGDVAEVVVVVTDAGGRTATTTATRDANAVTFVLR